MNEFDTPGYAEYTYAKRAEGGLRLARALLVAGYVAFVALYFLICYASRVIPIFALAPLFLWMLVYFTWKYVKPEYEYSVTSGRVTFSVIHGKRSRKEMVNFAIKNCLQIAPATEREWIERLELYDPEVTYSALSSTSTPDKYYAAFETEDGKRAVFYFEATEKMLKLCRNYNSAHTVITKVRY